MISTRTNKLLTDYRMMTGKRHIPSVEEFLQLRQQAIIEVESGLISIEQPAIPPAPQQEKPVSRKRTSRSKTTGEQTNPVSVNAAPVAVQEKPVIQARPKPAVQPVKEVIREDEPMQEEEPMQEAESNASGFDILRAIAEPWN